MLAAKLYAAGRLAYSAGLIFAPDRVAASWLGRAGAASTATRIGLRGLAGRDTALATCLLIADARGLSTRPWFGLCAIGDLADLAATLAAPAGDLPPNSRAGTVALAGGSAVVGAVLALRTDG
jgi:hypothetical protein